MKKNIKNLLMLVSLITLVCALFALSANAIDATGKCGDDAYWSYNEATGELVISGTGAITDYNSYPGNSPFHYSDVKSVVIQEGITSIGTSLFEGCNELASAQIPDSVTSIGHLAFVHTGLTEVKISENVTSIGDGAFSNCLNLKKIQVDEKNKNYLSDEYGVLFSKDKTVIVQYPIANAGKAYAIPEGVTEIGYGAFYGSKNLTSVTMPEGLKTIGTEAFRDCKGITNIIIPDGVTKIGILAFSSCTNLTDVVIPVSVTEIERLAFKFCSDIENVYYSGTQKQWKNIQIGADNSELTDATIHYNGDLVAKPDGIKAIQSAYAVKLSWTAASDADGYRVYLYTDGKWKAVKKVAGPTATIKGLTPGTKYTFAVISYKIIGGKVFWSDGYTAIKTATKAVKPAKVAAAQNTSAIKLAWSKCEGATGYRIYYKAGGAWKVCVKATTKTTHTFNNLKAGAKFTFAIRPYIKTNSGIVWSNFTQLTTSTRPAIPSVSVSSPSNGKIVLSWKAVRGADFYQVFYKKGSGAYKFYKAYSKAGTLTFTNIASVEKYTFAVRAGIKTSAGIIYGGYEPAKAGFYQTKDAWVWPVGNRSYFISLGFSDTIDGIDGTHGAVDITGSGFYGSSVYAARAGKVTVAGYDADGYGYYAEIDHGDGFVTMYAQNSKILVKTGDTVSKGQLIAYSGNSGNSTGAHLHFEIRYNGKEVNPATYYPAYIK